MLWRNSDYAEACSPSSRSSISTKSPTLGSGWRCRLTGASPRQRCPDQWQAIIAEQHRTAETTARNQFVSVGTEPRFAGIGFESREEALALETGPAGDIGQHRFARDVAVVPPVGLEGGGRIGNELALVERHQGAAHAFDAVHRKDARRKDDLEAVEPRPIGEVLEHVGLLQRVWPRAVVIDGLIDGVEHAADQNGLPADFCAELGCQRLHGMEGEVGPGAGAIEVK